MNDEIKQSWRFEFTVAIPRPHAEELLEFLQHVLNDLMHLNSVIHFVKDEKDDGKENSGIMP